MPIQAISYNLLTPENMPFDYMYSVVDKILEDDDPREKSREKKLFNELTSKGFNY
jgi:hypothetical protein